MENVGKSSESVVFLRGRRIFLRPPTKVDIPILLRWLNDEEVRSYLVRYWPLSEKEELEWVERANIRDGSDLVLLICLADGRPIGSIGLHKINRKDQTAETGTVIGEKGLWSQGYGTEAKMILLNYAFNTLNLRKIVSHVYAFNGRSRRYSEKCGYKLEGVLKKHVFVDGEYCDVYCLAVFREEWLLLWREQKERLIEI